MIPSHNSDNTAASRTRPRRPTTITLDSLPLRGVLVLHFADGREVALSQDRLRVGAASDNDVVIEDHYVSSYHCVISHQDGRWIVEDLDSRNGTRIGGARITRGEIRAGVRLTIGRIDVRVGATAGGDGDAMVGRSAALNRLRAEIDRFAPSSASVLIQGESGSGKELVAQALHRASGRKGRFVALNCGGLAAGVIESELFGHERGAFTGATQRRAGIFEEADGGTLFLDEIAEMPLELQARLLRVIETRQVRAVGASGERKVDVRLVTATHQDLNAYVAGHKFRFDLFQRINVLTLRVPSLRERREDIPLLAEHFLAELAKDRGTKRLSDEAMAALVARAWRGNVRELRNTLERATLVGGAILGVADVTPDVQYPMIQPDVPRAAEGPPIVDQGQRAIYEEALRLAGGSRRAAANRLGIAKSTFCDRLRRMGISVEDS